jgi:NADH-quinone oxidoreductase subunit G
MIHIDSRTFAADSTRNLLEVALSLGFDLPYFCWHPALGSVGACRQCAVKQFKDENDTRGTIVMACMVPATDGVRISIDDPEAKEFREGVIEWLMTNHPHDCPVCDEGGECHLQDMTVMAGHTSRRYRFKKRTYRNQQLGPFIQHEMNRCIQCYRCVRYYKGHAGGKDLDAFAAHNHVYFGRHEDGVLESEFSGNLVEVCPTGVFTDKTLKHHFTRKWDLVSAPSVCVHCGVGCNTIASERYGKLRRILNRYHHDLNGYFLCDRGRFGYDYVNHPQRIRLPRWENETLTKEAILARLAPLVAERGKMAGIGSPRASLEANHALRTLVGADRFSNGMSPAESAIAAEIVTVLRGNRAATVRDIEEADAVLVLGEDLTNTAPRLALALRQSVLNAPLGLVDALKIPRWNDRAVRDIIQHRCGPLHLALLAPTKLDEIATSTHFAAPSDLARIGFAIAHELDAAAPAVTGLSVVQQDFVRKAAADLRAAKRPLVIAGASLGSIDLVRAAANVARALCRGGEKPVLSLVVPEANTLGVTLFESAPLSGFRDAETIIVLENDLFRRLPSDDVKALLNGAKHIIALDALENPTTSVAHAVLPAGTFAESDGTFINQEGRAQRYFQVIAPSGEVQESWRWLRDLMIAGGQLPQGSWIELDDVLADLAVEHPALALVKDAAPSAEDGKWARASRRFSGRTSILAHLSVHEPKPPDDPDAPLSFTMEGSAESPPPALLNRYWSPGWNSVQALNQFQQEVGGPLRGGDPGIRLLDGNGPIAWFESIPSAGTPPATGLVAVPMHHIFGSEELSRFAPAIAERIPSPYLALNAAEAAKHGRSGEVAFRLGGTNYRLPLRIVPELPDGVAGFSVGFPETAGIESNQLIPI